MPPVADLVVIGGGIVGASAAYEAATAGLTTVLIDRQDPGRATNAGAGILSAETTANPDDRWYAFAAASAEHYRQLVPDLEARTGSATGYARCGALCLARRDDEMEWFAQRVDLAARRAPGTLHTVSPEEAVERFPPLAPPAAALHNPLAARVDGRSMERALRSAAGALGLQCLEASVQGLGTEGDRILEVHTSERAIPCGAVLVAGGAWSPSFATVLRQALPVGPMKGQIAHLEIPSPQGDHSAEWPIIQPVASYYLVPWAGGRVVCGGTMESDAGFDTRVTASGVHQLLHEALRLAPGLGAAALNEVRVGLRPTTPDDLPVLGRVPGWANAYVATGHGAEGLLLGPYSGRLVVSMVAGDDPDAAARDALRLCSPDRFAG